MLIIKTFFEENLKVVVNFLIWLKGDFVGRYSFYMVSKGVR